MLLGTNLNPLPTPRRNMVRGLLMFCLAGALASATDDPELSPFAQAVIARLQGPLDAVALLTNASFSVGLAVAGDSFGFAAGLDDHADAGSLLTPASRIPMGSATKLYTATALLKMHDAGIVDLDAPVHVVLDPFLTRNNGTTLAALWGNNASVNAITARQLMGMRSGLSDYDDRALQDFAMNASNWPSDITPYDYLHRWALKPLLCAPGTCGSYSSIGYVLLGMVAAAASGAVDWADFDQRAAIVPPALADALPGFRFAGLGACSADAGVAHQYRPAESHRESPAWTTVDYQDIYHASCLNGWTMGNIAAAPRDVAAMLYQVFGDRTHVSNPPILSDAALAAMQTYTPFTTGWSAGLEYGLGCMQENITTPAGEVLSFVGHGGADWGSVAPFHFYNAKYDFALLVAETSTGTMNCSALSGKEARPNQAGSDIGMCTICTVVQLKTNGSGWPGDCPCDPNKAHFGAALPTVPLFEQRRQQRQQQQRRRQQRQQQQRRQLGGAMLGAVSVPKICALGSCAGQSAALPAGECLAWKALFVGTGGMGGIGGTGGGWSGSCRGTAFAVDPCSCSGAVTCSAGHITALDLSGRGLVGAFPTLANATTGEGLTELVTLDLSNNTLFGGVPADLLAGLPKLASLSLANNLLSSKLPPLAFGGVAQSCDVSGNDFDCPLPASAADCKSGGVARAVCSSPPVSPTCLGAIFRIYGDKQVLPYLEELTAAVGVAAGRAGAKDCDTLFETHKCTVHIDWGEEPLKSDLAAANTAIRAADPGGDVCLTTMDVVEDIDGLGSVELKYVALEPLFFGTGCTAADRDAWAAWQDRPSQCLKSNGAGASCKMTLAAPSTCQAGAAPTLFACDPGTGSCELSVAGTFKSKLLCSLAGCKKGPTPAPAPSACAGSSVAAGIPSAECAAWNSLYDGTGGNRTWALCADLRADPCGCDGVTCASGHLTEIKLRRSGLRGEVPDLGALAELSSLDLSGNTLYGSVPASLDGVPKLATLLLGDNLFSGKLPPLDFGRLTGGCDVGGVSNEYDCPLPAAAAACKMPDGSARAVCTSPPLSQGCMAGIGGLYASPAVIGAAQKLYGDIPSMLAPLEQGCQPELAANRTCHMTLDWSQGQPAADLAAARAAVRAVAPRGDVCPMTVVINNTNCGGAGRCVVTVQNDEPLLFGGACTAAERDTWAQWQARPAACLAGNGPDAICEFALTSPATCCA